MSPKLKRDRQLQWIPLDRIIPNENNPRTKRHFTKDELLSLRASIKAHGMLEPILVQPYRDGPRDDRFLLLEGERRYTVATDLGHKEVPAIITSKLDDHDQLLVMYHVHTQRRGWEMAEQLRTIKDLLDQNGQKSESDMAAELGMSVATFRNRLSVLSMGAEVVADIGADKLDYSSALRINEVTTSLKKNRPKMVETIGGEKAVERNLLEKARERKGISQELVEAKRDLADTAEVPDTVVEKYITEPKVTLREVRKDQGSLEERREAERMSRDLRRIHKEIEAFDTKLEEVPNLRQLRAALGGLVDAAQDLELRIVEAINAGER